MCFVKSERADQAKVFQESAKKKTKILILAHVFTTLIKHIYINIMFAATQQIASVAGLKATKVQVRVNFVSHRAR